MNPKICIAMFQFFLLMIIALLLSGCGNMLTNPNTSQRCSARNRPRSGLLPPSLMKAGNNSRNKMMAAGRRFSVPSCQNFCRTFFSGRCGSRIGTTNMLNHIGCRGPKAASIARGLLRFLPESYFRDAAFICERFRK